ncbi:MAG: replication initiator protein [Microviridae sp.]|nr:MAG: replication initiator protein [Microviridae sp.]
MPCYHPREAWRSSETNASGKRPLVFDHTKGLSTHPVIIPCGGCIGCRLERARAWSLRLLHEKQDHELSIFVTLTYSDQYLPINRGLNPLHTQRFLKRLRKKHDAGVGNKLRFFLCGEYGEQTLRPHYHAILFGIDFPDKRKHSTNEQGDTLWTSETLEKTWGMGHCLTGNVTKQSCEYVARYILKKVNGELAEQHYQGREPEFIRMSRRPGIGKNYYDQYQKSLYTRDFVTSNGKQAPVPKYYDRLLEKDNPQLLEQKKIQRTKSALLRKADNTPERLTVRKEVRQARIKQLTRKL